MASSLMFGRLVEWVLKVASELRLLVEVSNQEII
jgi:hypothetical protein